MTDAGGDVETCWHEFFFKCLVKSSGSGLFFVGRFLITDAVLCSHFLFLRDSVWIVYFQEFSHFSLDYTIWWGVVVHSSHLGSFYVSAMSFVMSFTSDSVCFNLCFFLVQPLVCRFCFIFYFFFFLQKTSSQFIDIFCCFFVSSSFISDMIFFFL